MNYSEEFKTMYVSNVHYRAYFKGKDKAYVKQLNSLVLQSPYNIKERERWLSEILVGVANVGKKGGENKEKPYFPWMEVAINEAKIMRGVDECDNPLYDKGTEYHIRGGSLVGYCICDEHDHNNAPWCASFVNWCLKKVNIKGTNASSQSFVNDPNFVKIDEPVFGAIAVFRNIQKPKQGHVGFVVNATAQTVYLLGGNQGNKLYVTGFDKSSEKGLKFIDYFLPKMYDTTTDKYNTDLKKCTECNSNILNLNIKTSNNENTR